MLAACRRNVAPDQAAAKPATSTTAQPSVISNERGATAQPSAETNTHILTAEAPLDATDASVETAASTTVQRRRSKVIAEAAAQGFVLTQEEGSTFLHMPADILIGSDGRMLQAHYANYVWDHLPFATIEQQIGLVGAV